MKRFLSVLLLLALLLTLLPAGSLAANTDGFFYFSAENDDMLVVSPQKIPYSANQTIAEALSAAGVVLTYDSSNGFVTAINGKAGNYLYFSDFLDLNRLDLSASSVNFLIFTENQNYSLSSGIQSLTCAMAEYLCEETDVQNAAKASYNAALSAYRGISDANASQLAADLQAAISDYKSSLSDTCTVTVSASEEGCEFLAESSFGHTYTSDSGAFSLPKGTYTITARKENREASVTREITESTAVTGLTLPEGSWLDESSLELSSTNDNDGTFTDGKYTLTRTENGMLAAIPDTFSGKLYVYLERSAEAPKDASLYVRYTDASGNFYDQTFTEGSRTTSLSDVLARGTAGNTVQFSLDRKAEGCRQRMTLTLKLDRLPTLSGLTVTARSADNKRDIRQAAKEGAFSSLQTQYTYQLLSSLSEVTICPTASMPGYSITVDGKAVASGEGASVALNGETEVPVTVSGGGYTNAYTLTLQPGEGHSATFNPADGVTLCVTNAAGEVLDYDSARNSTAGGMSYFYTLVGGETYTYVATKGTYYHASAQFTLTTAASFSNITVPVEEPLTTLAFGANPAKAYYGSYGLYTGASARAHTYTITVPDVKSSPAIWVTSAWAVSPESSIRVRYACCTTTASSGSEKTLELSSGGQEAAGKSLQYLLLADNPYGNDATLRISRKDAATGVTYYTEYQLHFVRTLSLGGLTLRQNGEALTLEQLGADGKETGGIGFQPETERYAVTVPAALGSLSLTSTLREVLRYGDTDNGYAVQLAVDGRLVSTEATAEVPLSGTEQTEQLTLTLSHEDAAAQRVYTITVKKAASTRISFQIEPENALLFLEEAVSGNRIWPEADGAYPFSTGFTYRYRLTAPGYVGQSGEMQLEADSNGTLRLVLDGTAQLEDTVSMKLEQAPAGEALKQFEAEWPDFRGNAENNGVTNVKTPVSAEDSMLYWAVKLGSGTGTSAVSSPILVDDALIVYAGSTLYRVNKDTGAIEASGTMAGTSSFAINSATYADGMLFVALSNGRVQAFNAETLESLWLYTDPLGTQPNCPITVHNGYVYTGFWNKETAIANYVCLTVTDEDPSKPDEAKLAAWTYARKGGFYWAGAYVCDDFMLVGTDDGDSSYTSDTASMLLLDPKTGKTLDSVDDLHGDLRSTVCYDNVTNAYYATTKGGMFYRFTVEKRDGRWAITSHEGLPLSNGDAGGTPMSTSTPVVYNGRAYIGVSGSSQFGAYSGHNITVIDLTSWSIAYRVQTQGYPQTSGLLTTAYESENDCVYVYFFDNYTPGTLRMLRDRPRQTEAELLTTEISGDSGKEYQTAYALFTPSGAQAQYAICSPIVDSSGTIYFKNDSGYLMAFGSAVKELTATTTVEEYAAGQAFSMEGVTVTATLANGTTRDVTAMMSAPDTPLTVGQTVVTLTLGAEQTMYRNEQDAKTGEMKAGAPIPPITVELAIRVADPSVPIEGTKLRYQYSAADGRLTVSGAFEAGQRLVAACYDQGGRLTAVRVLSEPGETVLDKGSAALRLFVLDAGGRPVCRAVTVAQGA